MYGSQRYPIHGSLGRPMNGVLPRGMNGYSSSENIGMGALLST